MHVPGCRDRACMRSVERAWTWARHDGGEGRCPRAQRHSVLGVAHVYFWFCCPETVPQPVQSESVCVGPRVVECDFLGYRLF